MIFDFQIKALGSVRYGFVLNFFVYGRLRAMWVVGFGFQIGVDGWFRRAEERWVSDGCLASSNGLSMELEIEKNEICFYGVLFYKFIMQCIQK